MLVRCFFGVVAGLMLSASAAFSSPVDIIVLFVDHWEPGPRTEQIESLERWRREYPPFADRHRDSDGRPLRHSFFQVNSVARNGNWYVDDEILHPILDMCYDGYGEIDMHIHMAELSTPEHNLDEFRRKMDDFILHCQQHGVYLTAEAAPQTAFGFIHGMWALDNSRLIGGAREYCGVNEQLRALKELGCFADYTFPAWGPMNPSLHNTIFRAKDDERPWSYGYPENVQPVTVGGDDEWGDLMIFEGPWTPWPSSQSLGHMTPGGFDQWVQANVHVVGQEDWIFIKLHTHGIQQAMIPGRSETEEGTSTLWDAAADSFWAYVETAYNDGDNYRVHYVSAREAYNMVRAAEDGRTGNPYDYRDYIIAPYAHIRMNVSCRHCVEQIASDRALFRLLEMPDSLRVRMHGAPNARIEEALAWNTWSASDAVMQLDDDELSFHDATPSPWYRVLHDPVDFAARGAEIVGIEQPSDIESATLDVAAPNPFCGQTTITYKVPDATPVRIGIWNTLGQQVRTLVPCVVQTGEHGVVWDGLDCCGRPVASGIYVCRMTTPVRTERLLLTVIR